MEIKNVLTKYRQGKLDVDFDGQDTYEVLCADGVHYKYYIAHVVNGLEIAGQEVYLSFAMQPIYQDLYDRYDEGLITYDELHSHAYFVYFNELNDVYDYDCPAVITVGNQDFEVLNYADTLSLVNKLIDYYNDPGRYRPRDFYYVLQDLVITGKQSPDVYLHPKALDDVFKSYKVGELSLLCEKAQKK